MGQIYQGINFVQLVEQFNIVNFVETGTGICESLSYVLKNRKDTLTVYTIELMDQLYQNALKNFAQEKNVYFIKGFSDEQILNVLKQMSKDPCLFWLDAHFPGADFNINNLTYSSELSKKIRIPLESELRNIILSNRNIDRDVFVIDDLRIYKDGPYEDGIWSDRQALGGVDNEFVFELFSKTHHIYETYAQQGYMILFPKIIESKICENYIYGQFKLKDD